MTAPPDSGVPPQALAALADLVETRSGLRFIGGRRRELATKAARVFAASGCATWQAYLSRLTRPGGEALLERLVEALTVGETYFFRDRAAFDRLEHEVLPELIRRRREARQLRLWCAGCASGEEAYSLAIILRRRLPDVDTWQASILATDVSRAALARAEAGLYGEWSFRGTDTRFKADYFTPEGSGYRIRPAHRRLVRFAPLNLVAEHYPSPANGTAQMDLILCRNVLIYFAPEVARRVVAHLRASLVPGGWLVLGPSDALPGLLTDFETHAAAATVIYRRVDSRPQGYPPPELPTPTPLTPRPPTTAPRPPTSAPTTGSEPPDWPTAWRAAYASARRGDLAAAEALCRQAPPPASRRPEPYYLLGTLRLAQGDADAALAAFRQALYVDRAFVPAYLGLAALHRQAGRPAEARRALLRVQRGLAGRPADDVVFAEEGLTVARLRDVLVLALQEGATGELSMAVVRGLSVAGKILVGYGLILLLMGIQAVLVYQAVERSFASDRWVRHSQDVLVHAERIDKLSADMENGMRGFVITGDDAFLQPYVSGWPAMGVALRETQALVSDNPAQAQRIQAIVTAIDEWQRQWLEGTIQTRRSSAEEATARIKSGRGKAMRDQIRANLDEFSRLEQGLLTRRSEVNDAASRELQRLVIGGTILAALLGLAAALVTARSISRRVGLVRRSAAAVAGGDLSQTVPALAAGDEIDALGHSFNAMTEGLRQAASTKVEKESLELVLREVHASSALLAATATEILASVTQQGASTTEQAAAVSQTTATVDEVRVTAQHATQRAQAVAQMAQRAAEVADQGIETVEATVAGMQELRARVEAIAEQMLVLSEQTQQISEVITTVDGLADQSNLLAVNAAIEASRAGDQGRGFAVVAQEVRSLAERSKMATVQVRTILTDIQRATNAAVLATEQGTKGAEAGAKAVDRAGQAIRELATTIRELAEAAQQIVASAGQQGAGMDQIAMAMANINQATAETAAGARQLESAAGNINDLAQRLTGIVGQFSSNGHV